jgi:hypothetical protein
VKRLCRGINGSSVILLTRHIVVDGGMDRVLYTGTMLADYRQLRSRKEPTTFSMNIRDHVQTLCETRFGMPRCHREINLSVSCRLIAFTHMQLRYAEVRILGFVPVATRSVHDSSKVYPRVLVKGRMVHALLFQYSASVLHACT